MRFARRAKWLTFLFTPSVTPPTTFPDSYSRDVSLTQPYDGGGWGIPAKEEWGTQLDGNVGAAVTQVVKTIGDEKIYRLLCATSDLLAGAAPTTVNLQVVSPGVGFAIVISEDLTVSSEQARFISTPPIIGPGSLIRIHHAGGDASSQLRTNLYGIEVPLGVAFTI